MHYSEDNFQYINIKIFVINQCLESGVTKVPKVNNNRMNQFLF